MKLSKRFLNTLLKNVFFYLNKILKQKSTIDPHKILNESYGIYISLFIICF